MATQAERSDATTNRLLVATVTSLVEKGYRGATTTEIAKRAGVSRGAMLHHFPNRAALFAATADWIIDGYIDKFESGLGELPEDANRLAGAIDLLWEICSSPTHVAWLEFSAAAHHEPELAATVTLAGARMQERVRQTWAANFSDLGGEPGADIAPDFAVSLLQGLALTQRTVPDPHVAERVIETLKAISMLLDTRVPGIAQLINERTEAE